MDQLSSQWQATKELTGELKDDSDSLQFSIPNVPNPIWMLVDTPHLIKNIRTNLMKNDIEVSDTVKVYSCKQICYSFSFLKG